MNNLKENLIVIKRKILTIKAFKEKSALEKYMLRKHEPKKVKNAILLIANRHEIKTKKLYRK